MFKLVTNIEHWQILYASRDCSEFFKQAPVAGEEASSFPTTVLCTGREHGSGRRKVLMLVTDQLSGLWSIESILRLRLGSQMNDVLSPDDSSRQDAIRQIKDVAKELDKNIGEHGERKTPVFAIRRLTLGLVSVGFISLLSLGGFEIVDWNVGQEERISELAVVGVEQVQEVTENGMRSLDSAATAAADSLGKTVETVAQMAVRDAIRSQQQALEVTTNAALKRVEVAIQTGRTDLDAAEGAAVARVQTAVTSVLQAGQENLANAAEAAKDRVSVATQEVAEAARNDVDRTVDEAVQEIRKEAQLRLIHVTNVTEEVLRHIGSTAQVSISIGEEELEKKRVEANNRIHDAATRARQSEQKQLDAAIQDAERRLAIATDKKLADLRSIVASSLGAQNGGGNPDTPEEWNVAIRDAENGIRESAEAELERIGEAGEAAAGKINEAANVEMLKGVRDLSDEAEATKGRLVEATILATQDGLDRVSITPEQAKAQNEPSKEAEEAQRILIQLGHLANNEDDGLWGSKSRTAFRKYLGTLEIEQDCFSRLYSADASNALLVLTEGLNAPGCPDSRE